MMVRLVCSKSSSFSGNLAIVTSISFRTLQTGDLIVRKYGTLAPIRTGTLGAVRLSTVPGVTVIARGTAVASVTGRVVVANATTFTVCLFVLVFPSFSKFQFRESLEFE